MGLKIAVPVAKVEEKPEKNKGVSSGALDLATIAAAINKDKGGHAIVKAVNHPRVSRLPSGVWEWDFYTGGGWPKNRMSIVYGPESSWKTNIVLQSIATTQRLKVKRNKCAFVNLEQTFDPIWAAKLGVNVDDLLIINPLYGEECVDMVDALVRADDLALLAVDSVAALVPNKEIAQSVEKADVGTASLLVKRMVNKMMYAFAENAKEGRDPAVILINQTRFKIGVMFGDPETMPGGEAQKFLSSMRVRVYGKNVVDKNLNPVMPAFKEISAVVKKAKVPVMATSFIFKPCTYAHDGLNIGDTDSWNMVSDHLKDLGLLQKVGKGWLVPGGLIFDKLAEVRDLYHSDTEFKLLCQKLVIDAYADSGVLVEEQQHNPKAAQEPGEVKNDEQPVSE